jgi:2-polyprenyl-3-methyl-5-hydroxy-6-metoxy-1,4-benzoquinol methylase
VNAFHAETAVNSHLNIESQKREIIYASPQSAVSMTDDWYDIANLQHFWIRRRFDVLKRLANSVLSQSATVAEVGCGNGLLQRNIEDIYGTQVTGFDLNAYALGKNISRVSPIYCYDIHHRLSEFRSKFDLILLFDVLEHISDEDDFLQALEFHLALSGCLIVNVPAHNWLYSQYDKVAGHFRRYTFRQLNQILKRNSLRVRSYTYWGLPLIPLLIARKLLLTVKRQEQQVISFGFDPKGKTWNEALYFLSQLEPVPQRLFGSSLMAIVERD